MTDDPDIARKSFHNRIYIASLCLIAIFLPSSRWLLTVSEIILAVNWLAEGDFRTKFTRLRADRAAIAFILIYLLNVPGLVGSDAEFGVPAWHAESITKTPASTMEALDADDYSGGVRTDWKYPCLPNKSCATSLNYLTRVASGQRTYVFLTYPFPLTPKVVGVGASSSL